VKDEALPERQHCPCNWAIRCEEYNLKQSGIVRCYPAVKQTEEICPVAKVSKQEVLSTLVESPPAIRYEQNCLGGMPQVKGSWRGTQYVASQEYVNDAHNEAVFVVFEDSLLCVFFSRDRMLLGAMITSQRAKGG
jgi:hypothetical protein